MFKDDRSAEKQTSWWPIYVALRDAIVSHRLAPGTKLPEDELASIYDVSRTVVRSALQALTHDRLAQLQPNRGTFIASPTKQEAREVFEARLLIEPKVASIAAEVAKKSDISRLRKHMQAEHEAVGSGDASDAIAASAQFHIEIAEIANHTALTNFVRELVSSSSLVVALYWKKRETTCESHAHEALVEAIADGDGARAAALMKSHLKDVLSGLDVGLAAAKQERLADILRVR
ncbi:GntR family transcriptional regulator [Ensifer sp. LC163]|uniref:GntR family transcriptional regulator n=1 Tax=Ensifer sp. LC163 TaxID=1120652 RepID=UPI0008138739|nr:GntR family transcriptional regulator [Ensifer sp. LC163]OCP35756.1 GntR family transcriptional regulator [Ensifer sp. LC163]